MSDLYNSFNRLWHRPIIEIRQPRPGVRHQTEEKEVWHRFPIKGGITPREAMLRSMSRPNPLFNLIKVRD